MTGKSYATWVVLAGLLQATASVAQSGGSSGEQGPQPTVCRFVLQHQGDLTLKDGQKSMVLLRGEISKSLVLSATDGPQCIQLEGQNPVLFRYSWKLEEKTKSENYLAAVAFAGALEKLTAGLGPVIEAENSKVLAANTAIDKRLPGRKVEMAQQVTANKDRLSLQAGANKDLAAGLDDVLRQPVVRTRLEVERALELAGIKDSAVFLTEVQKRLSGLQVCLTEMADTMKKLAAASRPSPSDFCPSSEPERLEAALAKDFDKIDAGQAELLKMAARDEHGLADQPFFVGSTLLQFQRQKVLEGARKVGAFKRQLTEMQKPLSLGTVSYLPKEDQVWALRIERVEENAADSKVTQVAGDFKLRFASYSPVRLGIGAAVIYSFVENPEYQTKKVEGGYQIIESPNQKQYQAEGIAAVLTITPRGWTDPTFGGFFEVGVQPTEHLGLLAGAGIRLFDVVSFGAGIAFQQVDTLAPGLSMEVPISSESDLKTVKKFKPGLYLHFTVAIDVKK